MNKPKNREEFRKEIAEMFINALEEEGLNWKKGWTTTGCPKNGITKRVYSGDNFMYLSLLNLKYNYGDSRWITLNQIKDYKKKYHPNERWTIKKGSKAAYVIWFAPYDKKAKRGMTWEEYYEEKKNGITDERAKELTFYAKFTPVFNAKQIDGIKEEEIVNNNITEDELIGDISEGIEIEILNDGGDQAYYKPSEDKIHLPLKERFKSDYEYNATALHELAHSTGHEKRLNRDIKNTFGSEDYAFEELIAEITSCFMGINTNIESNEEYMNNHKAYVKSWIRAIKEKPDVLTKAIEKATEASNYMEEKEEEVRKKRENQGTNSGSLNKIA